MRLVLVLALALLLPSEAMADINLDAIIRIESNGNPKAFNWKTKATGLCQITPAALADWNKVNDTQLTMHDLWRPDVNRRVGDWYLNQRIPEMLRAHDLEVTVENVLAAYNWGVGNLARNGHKLPKETTAYLKKYRALTR